MLSDFARLLILDNKRCSEAQARRRIEEEYSAQEISVGERLKLFTIMIEETLRIARETTDPSELKSAILELHTLVPEMTPKQFEEYKAIYLETRKELRGVLAKREVIG